MTSIERRFHLLASIRYLSRNQVPGAIVECGVWRGGSVMLALSALIEEGIRDRDIYLYDTFEGMPDPGGEDIDAAGVSAHARLRAESSGKDSSNVWAIATLDEVRRNLSATDYPAELIHCVVGPVEATIPSTIPQQIALLRLDTDWYGSTSHELHYLYPKVVSGGVVIIDDYGYWRGARRAVDEVITRSNDTIL
ncbi:MAG: TylF/MycF/NovP-related O-methyltransferase, partial [Chthoniobacterales bacterium]